MSKKAEVINLEPSAAGQPEKRRLQLDSGRQVLILSDENQDRLEIVEPNGEVAIKVRLTDEGPVVTIRGAHLELKSTETLALEAKRVKIKAEEAAVVKSEGSLEIDSSKKMDIHSEDDIRVVGKMIYLN
ncbi:MAG: hypothetical protein JSV47_13535 [Deltaproteobacteria bacterium]|jgi:hypothetical protein|nr:MAG: hypothetical protein JSV47_13535 [Deltaproteobacteria bacterium]